jgi:hypothetical protein
MSKWAALLRYYSHFTLDPDKMDEDEFYKAVCQLQYSLKQTGQMQ